MKAISVRQPWAWAIVWLGKDIENRTWATRYRGPVLIHAATGMTKDEYQHFHDLAYRQILGSQIEVPAIGDLQRGGIIGRADIVDCVGEHASPWFFGPFGFVLADAVPLPFQACRGQLGLFEVEA